MVRHEYGLSLHRLGALERSMSKDAHTLAFGCDCGQIRGVIREVSPATINHVICYCGSCQEYAAVLNHAHILDAQGGTRVIQVAPSRFEVTHGLDQLASSRLVWKKGGAMRWYATCCHTPIAKIGRAHV